jgi:DNA-binding transcriptional MerR regulator
MSVDDVQFYRDIGLLLPPGRQPRRSGDFAFHAEHVERLCFIQRAIAFGFFLEDIQRFVDETNLVTCNDVYHIALHRLGEYRRARSSGHPTVIALERLIASCAGKGGRRDCQILATLSRREPEADQPK